MAKSYDVIIIGSGHNGLVCGSYLAKAGLKTLVLERRGVIGGAAVTEEFSPGFHASRFSYVMSLLHPRIIRDLELRRPIYRRTAAYGHFGRSDKELTWEATPRVDDLKRELGL